MFNSYEYLCHCLPEDEARVAASQIQSFDALTAWLEAHQKPKLSPNLNYQKILPPDMQTSWKKSFWARLHRKPSKDQTDSKPQEWMRVVAYRQKVILLLTIFTTLIILAAS
ncbi:MAG: hypothetical protein POH28_09380, partial [Acidocella sp.]|nr:hypothetical protein [Acidocella sp.]